MNLYRLICPYYTYDLDIVMNFDFTYNSYLEVNLNFVKDFVFNLKLGYIAIYYNYFNYYMDLDTYLNYCPLYLINFCCYHYNFDFEDYYNFACLNY
jgi:hypothetical protein